jgi:hypothetical protein
VANAVTAGVGQPVVVDESNAAAMRRPCRIDNIDVIDGLNRAILQSTQKIGEALQNQGVMAAAAGIGSGSEAVDLDLKLESLHKRRKYAIDVGDLQSIAHCERMIRLLEEKVVKEMEGAGGGCN